MDTQLSTYGEEIRTRREKIRVTKKGLAKASGVSYPMICKVEKHSVPITEKTRKAINEGLEHVERLAARGVLPSSYTTFNKRSKYKRRSSALTKAKVTRVTTTSKVVDTAPVITVTSTEPGLIELQGTEHAQVSYQPRQASLLEEIRETRAMVQQILELLGGR